jgi:hypothetical protein
MKCFTLDSNCIIDLEENRPAAVHLEELKRLRQSGGIELAVVSVSASENQPTGEPMRNYAEFEAKLERAGLTNARELHPVGIWDLGYWDHMLWSVEESERQLDEIKDIIFPGVQHDPPTEPGANSKWRNQMCDVLVAWTHGFHKSDYLVTSDKNFHKKAHDLVQYGVHNIVTPKEALTIAERSIGSSLES